MKDLEILDSSIRRVPDFPKKGILFYDVTGIFINPEAFKICIDRMVSLYRNKKIDGIAAVEARGFLLGAPLAERLELPLLLIRKKGKLPAETYTEKYDLEYGTAEIEAHKSDIQRGKNYLVVDDLIATGGTLAAARSLIAQGGGTVSDFFGVVGLKEFDYENVLAPSCVTTLINYGGK
ncbi:MAG: adenine phosphoribosyltransferase [Treponema sp.]|nr:adenine phosphoribosyltransferase [Treponema sp.]